jgi:hypothetical protein
MKSPCSGTIISNEAKLTLTDESGIADFDFTLSVYPNPSNDMFHITSSNAIDRAKVYDLQGSLILDFEQPGSTFDIDLSLSAKGIYFLQLFAKSNTNTIRLMRH